MTCCINYLSSLPLLAQSLDYNCAKTQKPVEKTLSSGAKCPENSHTNTKDQCLTDIAVVAHLLLTRGVN